MARRPRFPRRANLGSPVGRVAALPAGSRVVVTTNRDKSFDVLLYVHDRMVGRLVALPVEECLGGRVYSVIDVEGPGYGPILYDVAMEHASAYGLGLTADKFTSTSLDATNVWQKYGERTDVRSLPMSADCPTSRVRGPGIPLSGSTTHPATAMLNRYYKKEGREVTRALASRGMLMRERSNPTAVLDAKGIAHVDMPDHAEGWGSPRTGTLTGLLKISARDAERLRARMRKGDSIREILLDASRSMGGKGSAYYPGMHDTTDAPDGVAFVDLGDPKKQTLVFDHRDARFIVSAWGEAVARQPLRFAKHNPSRRSR